MLLFLYFLVVLMTANSCHTAADWNAANKQWWCTYPSQWLIVYNGGRAFMPIHHQSCVAHKDLLQLRDAHVGSKSLAGEAWLKEGSTEFTCLTQLTKFAKVRSEWPFLLHEGTKTDQLSLSPCNLATLIPTGSYHQDSWLPPSIA